MYIHTIVISYDGNSYTAYNYSYDGSMDLSDQDDCEDCGGKTFGDKVGGVMDWLIDAYNTIDSVNQQQVLLELRKML